VSRSDGVAVESLSGGRGVVAGQRETNTRMEPDVLRRKGGETTRSEAHTRDSRVWKYPGCNIERLKFAAGKKPAHTRRPFYFILVWTVKKFCNFCSHRESGA